MLESVKILELFVNSINYKVLRHLYAPQYNNMHMQLP